MGKAAAASGSKKGAGPKLDENDAIVLSYMEAQNRPYNGIISQKMYGKTSIYFARQDQLPAPSSEELGVLDREIAALTAKLAAQREATKEAQSKLALVQSSLTNEEIEARLLCAASDSAVLEKKLATLRSGTRRVDPLEKAKVDKSLDLYSKEWKKRRAQCLEIVNAITENLPQSPTAFMEDLGMEGDPPAK